MLLRMIKDIKVSSETVKMKMALRRNILHLSPFRSQVKTGAARREQKFKYFYNNFASVFYINFEIGLFLPVCPSW